MTKSERWLINDHVFYLVFLNITLLITIKTISYFNEREKNCPTHNCIMKNLHYKFFVLFFRCTHHHHHYYWTQPTVLHGFLREQKKNLLFMMMIKASHIDSNLSGMEKKKFSVLTDENIINLFNFLVQSKKKQTNKQTGITTTEKNLPISRVCVYAVYD